MEARKGWGFQFDARTLNSYRLNYFQKADMTEDRR